MQSIFRLKTLEKYPINSEIYSLNLQSHFKILTNYGQTKCLVLKYKCISHEYTCRDRPFGSVCFIRQTGVFLVK